ncbi:glycine cleavage system aminomethyltransferase GcvT [Baekduia sp.]|uniref:glycine cleavage system aminomethyltransferase GcvT n=1 Tax=Baekduia sp. TaxID=2600305 RepID=UPI002E017ED2|nr:glycine cleavage system aminomethyltransferase GcvT [Baekduia sp.]
MAAASADTALKRTPLYDKHVAAGAKLVPFAGWEMPVQYGDGVKAEHLATRATAGVFDVSHMGEIATSGPEAEAFLQHILSNDITKLQTGGAQYSVLCREDGGVLDDLFTYRLGADSFLTVTNASNHDKDLAWFLKQAEAFDVTVTDAHDQYAMLAVQGPQAREIVQALADGPLPDRFTCRHRLLRGQRVLVCGTGYTGEDGVELLIAPADAPMIWDEVVRRGAVPAGLAARDTLRLEVNYHLYGNDLMEERGPIEAGLGWACKEETGFIGSDAVRAVREAGPSEQLIAFTMASGIARQGNPVVGGGEVTSGTMSPSLEIGIGMAYVPAAMAAEGTEIQIDVRGKQRAATVAKKPLYKK